MHQDWTFIAIGPLCWGISTQSPDQAIRIARDNWPEYIGTRPARKNFGVWITDAPVREIEISSLDGSIRLDKKYILKQLWSGEIKTK
jgi:hypothetical protein